MHGEMKGYKTTGRKSFKATNLAQIKSCRKSANSCRNGLTGKKDLTAKDQKREDSVVAQLCGARPAAEPVGADVCGAPRPGPPRPRPSRAHVTVGLASAWPG